MNTNSLKQFVEQNLKGIVALLAAIVLIFIIFGVLKDVAAKKEQEASNALFEAHTKADALTKENKTDDAIAAYQAVVQSYGSTRAAYEATLQMGDLWMDKGKFNDAATAYTQAVDKAQDHFSKILALYDLGTAKESAGQYQDAVKFYEEAKNSRSADFLLPELLMAEGRCYEALKDVAKATEVYQSVKEKYEGRNSYYTGAANAFLSELKH